jgi:hypothetical protein
VSEVREMVVPTLFSARPIRTGTEYVNGMENTARVCYGVSAATTEPRPEARGHKLHLSEMTTNHFAEGSRTRTRVDMFSAPTMTMTNGSIYVGSVLGVLEVPQPFHPRRARTENDMTDEQHS